MGDKLKNNNNLENLNFFKNQKIKSNTNDDFFLTSKDFEEFLKLERIKDDFFKNKYSLVLLQTKLSDLFRKITTIDRVHTKMEFKDFCIEFSNFNKDAKFLTIDINFDKKDFNIFLSLDSFSFSVKDNEINEKEFYKENNIFYKELLKIKFKEIRKFEIDQNKGNINKDIKIINCLSPTSKIDFFQIIDKIYSLVDLSLNIVDEELIKMANEKEFKDKINNIIDF